MSFIMTVFFSLSVSLFATYRKYYLLEIMAIQNVQIYPKPFVLKSNKAKILPQLCKEDQPSPCFHHHLYRLSVKVSAIESLK